MAFMNMLCFHCRAIRRSSRNFHLFRFQKSSLKRSRYLLAHCHQQAHPDKKDEQPQEDIFGIESDKDALCFEERPICPEKFSYLFPKGKKDKEVVKVMSFGTVRIDSWNPAVVYRSEHDFSESASYSEHLQKPDYSEVQPELKNLTESREFRSNPENIESGSAVKKPENKRNISHANTNGVSYVDDIYFGSVLSDEFIKKSNRNQTSTDIKTSSPVIITQYSAQLKKEDIDLSINTRLCSEENLDDSETRNVSYIDNAYFGSSVTNDFDKSKTSEEIGGSSIYKKNVPINHETSSPASVEVRNDFSSVNDDMRSVHLADAHHNSEPTQSGIQSHEFLSEIDKQYFGEVLRDDNSDNTTKEFRIQGNESRLVSQSQNRLNFKTVDDVISDKILTNAGIETVSEFDAELDLEEPKHEKDLDEEIMSAKELVLKMRKNRVKTSVDEKGELILPSENVQDSKGFRILKYQVPDLNYLTRNELLLLLKNQVLYSNDDLLIIDKPYNLVIHQAESNKEPSLSMLLDEFARMMDDKNPNPKLYTVHRIDKETTGCFVLARNEYAAAQMKVLFAQQKILKKYWIVTSRVPDPLEGVIDIPISEGEINKKKRMVLSPEIPKGVPYKSHSKRGKQAITHYRVISISGNAALIEVVPETGLKHQIRVHFGFGLNCPIIGDHKYSHLDKLAPQKLSNDILHRLNIRQSKVRYVPMHIHSHSVTIPHFLGGGRNIFVSAPLPDHMRRNLRSLKFRKK